MWKDSFQISVKWLRQTQNLLCIFFIFVQKGKYMTNMTDIAMV